MFGVRTTGSPAVEAMKGLCSSDFNIRMLGFPLSAEFVSVWFWKRVQPANVETADKPAILRKVLRSSSDEKRDVILDNGISETVVAWPLIQSSL